MDRYNVSAYARIEAPAAEVYALLADYRDGHPRILPPEFFSALKIEQGGTGAGTVIRFQLRAFGTVRSFRAEVAEPEPGRVLVETNLSTDEVTTFRVVPAGAHAQVTITTSLRPRAGVAGWIERLVTTRFLQRVYAEELRLLACAVERPRLRAA